MFNLLAFALQEFVGHLFSKAAPPEADSSRWENSLAAGVAEAKAGHFDVAERLILDAVRLASNPDGMALLVQGAVVDVAGLDQSLYMLGQLYDDAKKYRQA